MIPSSLNSSVLQRQFPAGSFFQNNASILGPLTSFARDQIDKDSDEKKESYLVDAYCGSGLFSLTLAEHL
jgi:tRNA (uracil-5-)-methyltransferase